MAKAIHARPSSHGASCNGNQQQPYLRNAPLPPAGFPLICTVHPEGNQIHTYEVTQKYLPIHLFSIKCAKIGIIHQPGLAIRKILRTFAHMTERNKLHPRNKHSGQYDFAALIAAYPPLERHVSRNAYGTLTIDFFKPQSVKALNKALLMSYYGISYWDIPPHCLCPPIPGRADYIHYVADLIRSTPPLHKPENEPVYRCLDIGTGANCIYPIIGCTEYGWTFVGTDIDPTSLANARKIATCNPILAHRIELRQQMEPLHFFKGIIRMDEYFDVSVCNPPFHSSAAEAEEGTLRKLSSLKGRTVSKALLNFGGNAHELWCEGGELRFLLDMIAESQAYSRNVGWFTTLVSKEKNLSKLYAQLKAVGVAEYKTIPMQQGTKSSRILAWRFE